MDIKSRFLNYVSYWTTSSEDTNTTPSTSRQFELARVLEKELQDLGLEKVLLDDKCYVYGLLPAFGGWQ